MLLCVYGLFFPAFFFFFQPVTVKKSFQSLLIIDFPELKQPAATQCQHTLNRYLISFFKCLSTIFFNVVH